jgi:hypothetical protein
MHCYLIYFTKRPKIGTNISTSSKLIFRCKGANDKYLIPRRKLLFSFCLIWFIAKTIAISIMLTEFSRSRVCPTPGTKGGGGHTRLRVRGWGSPNSDDWRKSSLWIIVYSVM